MTETISRVYAHWRTTVTRDEDDKLLSVEHRCVLCGFGFVQNGQPGMEACNQRIHEANARKRLHERAHPAEVTVRDFLQFKAALHNSLLPYHGLEALMQKQ